MTQKLKKLFEKAKKKKDLHSMCHVSPFEGEKKIIFQNVASGSRDYLNGHFSLTKRNIYYIWKRLSLRPATITSGVFGVIRP